MNLLFDQAEKENNIIKILKLIRLGVDYLELFF